MSCVNIHTIAHDLGQMHGVDLAVVSGSGCAEKRILRQCALWDDEGSKLDDVVYVIGPNDSLTTASLVRAAQGNSRKKRGAITCLFAASPPDGAIRGVDYVVVPECCDFARLFNDIQSIFRRYLDWEESLQHALFNGCSAAKMVELSNHVIGNSVLMHDNDFNVIACEGSSLAKPGTTYHDFYAEYGNTGLFPLGFLESLLSQESFRGLPDKPEPVLWRDESRNEVSAYVSINLMGGYCLHITVDPTAREIHPGDLELLRTLARYIDLCYRMPFAETEVSPERLGRLLGSKMLGDFVDEESLTQQMHMHGWSHGDHLICAKVAVNSKSYGESLLKSIADRLQSVNKGCRAFVLRDHVALVQNLTRAGLSEADFLSTFEKSLAENGLNAGVSYAFKDIFSLDKLYKQADIALRYGTRKKGSQHLSLYEDAILSYLIGGTDSRLPLEYVCPLPLIRLMSYDRKNEADLTGTLESYLETGCNVSKCSDKIFIHRTTLTYRIKRIAEITGVDLDDADIRLLYQNALRMIGNKVESEVLYQKACRVYGVS